MIAALPSDIFEQLLDPGSRREIGEGYLGKTRAIEYFAALCLLCEIDRQFHPFYWTNVADTDLGFIGLIEQTNLVPLERYDGRHFLYVANYLPRDHELLTKDMDELIDVLRAGAAQGEPRLSSATGSSRAGCSASPRASRSCCRTTATGCRRTDAGVPGLYLANTTQVYPDDRGTNYAVREAEEVVAALLREAGHEAPVPRERFGVPALV